MEHQSNQEPEPQKAPESHKEPARQVHHHYHGNKKRDNFGRVLVGVFIVLLGLGYLGNNLGLFSFNIDGDIWQFWPVLIIIAGVSMLTGRGWFGKLLGVVSVLLVIGLLAVFVVGKGNFQKIELAGQITSESREVSDFSSVALEGVGNLILEQGEEESLIIEADANIVEKIKTEVVDGTLKIEFDDPWYVWNSLSGDDINFYVGVDDLERVSIGGSGSITGDEITTDSLDVVISGSGKVNMSVTAEELNSRISGSGKYELSGQATSQSVHISGSGKYLAEDLVTQDTEIVISGSGKAEVNTSETLSVVVSGSGSVTYVGDPEKIESTISGSGNVIKVEPNEPKDNNEEGEEDEE